MSDETDNTYKSDNPVEQEEQTKVLEDLDNQGEWEICERRAEAKEEQQSKQEKQKDSSGSPTANQ